MRKMPAIDVCFPHTRTHVDKSTHLPHIHGYIRTNTQTHGQKRQYTFSVNESNGLSRGYATKTKQNVRYV